LEQIKLLLILKIYLKELFMETIKGQWIASSMNLTTIYNGSLNMAISFSSIENVSINKVSTNYDFPLNQLKKLNLTFLKFSQFRLC
jgi:hypothetical protein